MINIIYSSSNQYFPYCLTSMYSLLENNPELTEVQFYVLSNNICDRNKDKMQNVCKSHNASVSFIETEDIRKSIQESGAKLNFNVSSFLRIFIPSLLPLIDKALFIDSDTLVQNGIKELYDTDLENYACAMVYNQPIYKEFLAEAELQASDGYYNAGVILLNLKYWRDNSIQSRILNYYYTRGGDFGTDDQSIINAIVAKHTIRLPYKFNAMVASFYCSYRKFNSVNPLIAPCSFSEYTEAHFNPVIIHFNGPGVRPWEYFCGHPYTRKFRMTMQQAFGCTKLTKSKCKRPYLYLQWLYHKMWCPIEVWVNNRKY